MVPARSHNEPHRPIQVDGDLLCKEVCFGLGVRVTFSIKAHRVLKRDTIHDFELVHGQCFVPDIPRSRENLEELRANRGPVHPIHLHMVGYLLPRAAHIFKSEQY